MIMVKGKVQLRDEYNPYINSQSVSVLQVVISFRLYYNYITVSLSVSQVFSKS